MDDSWGGGGGRGGGGGGAQALGKRSQWRGVKTNAGEGLLFETGRIVFSGCNPVAPCIVPVSPLSVAVAVALC